MLKGFKALLFIAVTGITVLSCVKGDNPIVRPDNPRNQGGVPYFGPGWTKLNIGAGFYDVFFVNDTMGYLAGENGVYRSVNGGQNWSKCNVPSAQYFNLYFINEKFGWAVSNQTLARTVDSGKTWTSSNSSFNFSDVFFLDENFGYATSAGGVLISKDAGVTWTKTNTVNNPAGFTLTFRDSKNGFISTQQNGYWKTSDSGVTFTRVPSMPNSVYNTQFLSDGLTGMAMGADGRLYKTADGGNTWNSAFSVNDNYFDFSFSDANNGFIMTQNFVYKVTGTTLSKELYTPIGSDRFVECHFTADGKHGWVVNFAGYLYRYVQQ